MPEIPIIPQRKTNKRLSFSLAGEIVVNKIAITVPIINDSILYLSHVLILLPINNMDIKINPKKKAQVIRG
tara:strand:+ start:696 stop:908 length:213 start_codon:yes stop_codon:yes gene_type:complete